MTQTIHPQGESNEVPQRATSAAERLVRAARALFDRGLIVGLDGNLSLRLPAGDILITPSGAVKGWLEPRDLLRVDLQGRVLAGPPGARPSSELAMHLAVYRARPGVGAVVHAHPPSVVACSALGLPLLAAALPEAVLVTGPPVLLPYATPSTDEGAAILAPQVNDGDCFVLERHGSLTVAPGLDLAFARTESLEQLARFSLLAWQVRGGRVAELELTAAQLAALTAVRRRMGWATEAV